MDEKKGLEYGKYSEDASIISALCGCTGRYVVSFSNTKEQCSQHHSDLRYQIILSKHVDG